MPRKAKHGGSRQGTQGKVYSNRTDLNQAPRAAATDTYGEAAALKRGQEQVPLPQAPPVAMGMPVGAPMPGEGGGLAAPTQRPGEPVTAGLQLGAGPGPEALAMMPDSTMETLRAIYAKFPNPWHGGSA